MHAATDVADWPEPVGRKGGARQRASLTCGPQNLEAWRVVTHMYVQRLDVRHAHATVRKRKLTCGGPHTVAKLKFGINKLLEDL